MSLIQNLKDNLKQARTLDLMSSAFIEISAIKMKRFRQQLYQNRDFYAAIKDVYLEVKASGREKKLFSQIVPDSKLLVALTSNRRFYGTQNVEIFKRFIGALNNNPSGGMLIGLTGKTLLDTNPPNKPIEVILFKDDIPTTREIYTLLDRIKQFERVYLYHPHFINLMEQDTTVTDITYNPTPEEEKKSAGKNFIFEPELPDIINFFETHVRFLLFRRSLLEVELARTSARLVAMIKAQERSREVIEKNKRQLRIAQKSLINARLLEGLAGIKQRNN